jgi:glutathione S-transferase
MELYYAPLACSLSARIVAREADLPLTLRQVEIFAHTFTDSGARYADVVPVAMVPALRTDDGTLLTEAAAVLQYLADLRPDAGLAPAWGTPDRYRLIQWLSFVATELHKRVLWPIYNRVPPEARAFARGSAPRAFDHVARHLADREHVVGDRFTAADAHLTWALHLATVAGLDPRAGRPALAAYLDRVRARPAVRALLAEETAQAAAAMARQRA